MSDKHSEVFLTCTQLGVNLRVVYRSGHGSVSSAEVMLEGPALDELVQRLQKARAFQEKAQAFQGTISPSLQYHLEV